MRTLPAASSHQPARVTNYEGEMGGGNYINLDDDDIIDAIYLLGEKDVAAECDALRGLQADINPDGDTPAWLLPATRSS